MLAAGVEAAQVGDEQHRLDDARGHERPVLVDAGHPALAVDAPRTRSGRRGRRGIRRRARPRAGAGKPDRQEAAAVVARARCSRAAGGHSAARGRRRAWKQARQRKCPAGSVDRRRQRGRIWAQLHGSRRDARCVNGPWKPGSERPLDLRAAPPQVARMEHDDRDPRLAERQRLDLRHGTAADRDLDHRVRRACRGRARGSACSGPGTRERERAVGGRRRRAHERAMTDMGTRSCRGARRCRRAVVDTARQGHGRPLTIVDRRGTAALTEGRCSSRRGPWCDAAAAGGATRRQAGRRAQQDKHRQRSDPASSPSPRDAHAGTLRGLADVAELSLPSPAPMGELGAFLRIHRVGFDKRKPRERVHDYKQYFALQPEEELARQGARCMDLRDPVLPRGVSARQPDPGLERSRLPRTSGARRSTSST